MNMHEFKYIDDVWGSQAMVWNRKVDIYALFIQPLVLDVQCGGFRKDNLMLAEILNYYETQWINIS